MLRAVARRVVQQRRNFGGHGHDDHGAAPTFLNLAPGRAREGWEWASLVTFSLSGLLTVVFLWSVPDTNPATAARAEALERRRRREAGEEIEGGRSYVNEAIRERYSANKAA